MDLGLMGGPPRAITVYSGHIKPIHDRVIVRQMNFDEMVTKGGIILPSDDGKSHGVKPRWGKVYAKGHENRDEFEVGDWVLVEHGRWTRGFNMQLPDEEEVAVLRTIEAEGILAWQKEDPDDAYLGDMDQDSII
ncbi:uncharacterized protein METZ01_LOCUS194730 [marine metagenome]|uniref:10 kDa chaperonin n=1 Tax=marine metagenome TaxID=408172 RepID=A0A382DTP9_9ZZZZ